MNLILKLMLVLGISAIRCLSGLIPGSYGECDPFQYLSFDQTDVIECSFANFYGVYWYNTTDSTETYPLVVFEDSKKSGNGYLSGQYDVYPNGSLIIKTVSLKDDHPFRVILLQEKRGSSITFDIRVYVVVRSNQGHPFIDVCGNASFCFTKFHEQHQVNCVLSETRPPANLTWVARNESGDWTIPFESFVSPSGPLYTTEIQTVATFRDDEYTLLLVCKLIAPPNVVPVHEASVLIESLRSNYSSNDTLTINIEITKKLTLTCDINDGGFISWKKEAASKNWITIADVYIEETAYWKIYDDVYTLDENASLIVYEVDIDQEGNYVCVHSVGRIFTLKSFEVIVFVPPEPPFVIIEECEGFERCTLNVSDGGSLKCSLLGVRPEATLRWLPYPEDSSNIIKIENCEQVTVKTGDTFDISLTAVYTRKDVSKTSFVVECRVFDWDFKIINMDRKVELRFLNGQQENDEDLLIGLAIGLSAGLFTGLLIGFFPLTKKKYREKIQKWILLSNDQAPENHEMGNN